MTLSPYARNEWLTLAGIGLLLAITAVILGWWSIALICIAVTGAMIAFFRDPIRRIPSQRGVVVAPADGRISSIHELEHYAPFDGPALCIRIFLSVLDVHINRSPCHGRVLSITHKPGKHLNALTPQSAEDNESNLIVMGHPVKGHPIATVRQVAGLLARTIYCDARVDDTLQRGQKIGIIKLGSTTEVYLPQTLAPKATLEMGQKVKAGQTVIANIIPLDLSEAVTKPPATATVTA